MKHTFDLKNYEDLEGFFECVFKSFCPECKESTYHCKVTTHEKLDCLKCGNRKNG